MELRPSVGAKTRALISAKRKEYLQTVPAEERSRQASERGNIVLRRYGVDFFAALGKKSAKSSK